MPDVSQSEGQLSFIDLRDKCREAKLSLFSKRSLRRFMDIVKDDMETLWSQMICCKGTQ